MSHDGIFVILVEVNDPVVSVKRPEKRHLEFCIRLRINNFRSALCISQFAAEGTFKAFVEYLYLPIAAQGVCPPAPDTPLLEPVRVPADLLPDTCIAGEVNERNNRKRRCSLLFLRYAGQEEGQCNSYE